MEDPTLNPVDMVSSDRPLESPDLDRLGYAPFARHLAKSLTETLSREGLVLGLYGNWGSGKSTLINFLVKELEGYDEKKRPIIVRFNPWWYSGSSNLVSRFLLEFSYGISGWTRVSDKLRESLSDFADVLGDVGVGGISIGAGKAVSAVLRPNRSAERLRDKVVRGLEELDRRILVIVDDVDRLHRDEILQLFLAIKAIGSFPHTNYILAMDKRVVVGALAEVGFGNGEEFLEKIVQIPLELPDIDRVALENMMFMQLDRLLSDIPQGQFDTDRWGWLFTQGIRPILRTPRQVIQLVNCLSMIYPVVKGEVNPVDLIGIEFLRLFFYSVYQAIRRYPSMFLSSASHWRGADSNLAKAKKFHEAWVQSLPEAQRSPCQYLVTSLFPGTAAALSSYSPDSADPSRARRELRICAPGRFPVYFRLWVPADELRVSELAELMDAALDGQRFAEKLLQFSREQNPDGTSRVGVALDRLADLSEEPLPSQVVVGALAGLMEVGDHLMQLRDPKIQLFTIENDSRVMRCISLLGRQLDRESYARQLYEWIPSVDSVTIPLREVADLAREHGLLDAKNSIPEAERRFTLEEVKRLEAIAGERLRREAREGTLLGRPWLGFLLNLWRNLGGEEDAKSWVAGTLKDEKNIPAFLAGFAGRSRTSSGRGGIKIEHFIDGDSLQRWVNLEDLYSRADDLVSKGGQSPENREILEAFIRMRSEQS